MKINVMFQGRVRSRTRSLFSARSAVCLLSLYLCGLCAANAGDNTGLSDYLTASHESYSSKIKSIKADMIVEWTENYSPPSEVSVGTSDKPESVIAASLTSKYRYTLFLNRGKVRYDRHMAERTVVLADGKSITTAIDDPDLRRAFDGTLLRTVTVGLPFSNTVTSIDSPRSIYPTTIDGFSNIFTQHTVPPHGTLVAEKGTVEEIQTSNGSQIKISVPCANGMRLDAWIDPAKGYRLVRRELWAKGNSDKMFLNVETNINYFQADSIWVPKHLAQQTWLPPQTSGGKSLLSDSIIVDVDPITFELNKPIDDAVFTFTGMGIDPRGRINDLKTGMIYAYNPIEDPEVNVDDFDLRKIIRKNSLALTSKTVSRYDNEIVSLVSEEEIDIKTQKGLQPRASVFQTGHGGRAWIIVFSALCVSCVIGYLVIRRRNALRNKQ